MSDITPRPYSKDYEITDAMFGAFRTSGGAGFFFKLLAWATVIFTVVYALLLPPLISTYVDLFQVSVDLESDPEAVNQLFGSFGLIMFWALLLGLGGIMAAAVLRAAFYRAYFFGHMGGFFPFRLGGDEVRQFLAMLGYYGLFILGYFGIAILMGIVGGVAAVAGGDGGIAIMIILMIFIYIGIFVFFVWYGVRFVCAGALTALRGKTHVLAARHVSRGRFWAIFGSIFVAGLIGYVVSYIATLFGMMFGMSGLLDPDFLASLEGDSEEEAFEAFGAATQTVGFKIGAFFAILMTAAGYAFFSLIVAGPSAFFVRQWDNADPAKAFE